ncbi:phage tail protein [Paenibacillus ginsengarvi]|uniref:Phage tail protein n=1 Tax=Paenibacillus ginsengarvi TaxID=400777 RepID=A0A3B0BRK0_9BACL|nr:phage tail protein [Paenibacillus ginsengarvi]RKN75965.1 hypothetical protein D7M11_24495 [Paenibacillus ginsengarvi]
MRQPARFFSLNKPSDWETGTASNMTINEDGVTIGRVDKYSIYRTVHTADIDGADAIADFAVGSGSKLYVLDAKAALWVHDYENRYTEPFYVPGHNLFTGQSLLAARGDSLYIADRSQDRRIVSISPSNGQIVWAAHEWNGLELFPLAVAVDGMRRLYTAVPLDTQPGQADEPEVPEGGRIVIVQWGLSGEMMRQFGHDEFRLEHASPLSALHRRFAVTVSDSGEPAMLDTASGQVVSFHADGSLKAAFRAEPGAAFASVSVDARGLLYIGEAQEGDPAENERFIRSCAAGGKLLGKVSGYRARADKLLHDGRARMYALDLEKGSVTLLDLQSRTMAMPATGLPEAWYISAPLDSTEDETEWHKMELLADIPEETQVRISYFATDERFGVLDGQVVDYESYFADPAIPMTQKWSASRHLWSEPVVNPQDALLMNARGRYLRFRLELAGSDRSGPVIRRLRLHFPRLSPIVYLPPIYQEDPDGGGFLERFLAIFGTFFAEMEERIAGVSSNFDPDSVTGAYLRWLGGWLALDIADSWEEPNLRELMKQAPELYKMRGTRAGLKRMLHIYTGVEPFVVEHHELKHMQEQSELRQLLGRLYGDNPYSFCVMLPPDCVRTDKQRLMVETIIDDQKPAYTEGKLIVLQPWMHTDMHTYLGINTVLSEPTVLTLDKQSSMPHHTVLVDKDRDKRIDIHTRMGLDSELD